MPKTTIGRAARLASCLVQIAGMANMRDSQRLELLKEIGEPGLGVCWLLFLLWGVTWGGMGGGEGQLLGKI